MQEDSKRTKVQKHKSEKWHGNEGQMNISVYHTLQSCGVRAGRYPKTEVKMKLIFLALKELSGLWNLGFHLPKLDYHQWLKLHTFNIWEIHTSRRIQHVGIIKTVCCLKKKLPRDLCSLGSHQLLQLQLFPKFYKFGKKGCSCNNWWLPGEHRSLDNIFFDQHTVLIVPTYRILQDI